MSFVFPQIDEGLFCCDLLFEILNLAVNKLHIE